MNQSQPPLLLIDVDGVISLFGFDPSAHPAGSWLLVEGIPHLLSATAARELGRLADAFTFAWCTGWEERANDHLLGPLGLRGPLPVIHFDARAEGRGLAPRAGPTATPAGLAAHWKLAAIEAFAPAAAGRPLAWIDDRLDAACARWAAARPAPTLLVATDSAVGLTARHADELLAWAAGLATARGRYEHDG